MKQIHIVGCSPRSGTTLLHEMMISCFRHDYHCAHELSVLKCDDTVITQPGVSITKDPGEALIAATSLEINPHLHILYLRRDPRDVIVSRHKQAPDQYFTHLGIWKRNEKAARKLENHPRFIVINYEDLVKQPDQTQNQLIQALPWLEITGKFSTFTEYAKPSQDSINALNGLRPATPSSIGRWHEHKQRVANQIALHGEITSWLVNYGYEKDDSWSKTLPAGTPLQDSFLEDKPSLGTRLKKWKRRTRKLMRYRKRIKKLHPAG